MRRPTCARTLGHVRQLLAPGGLLAMLEVTAPQRWFDLTVGLTDGWWAFTDTDLRPRLRHAVARRRWLRAAPRLRLRARPKRCREATAQSRRARPAVAAAGRAPPAVDAAERHWLLACADRPGGAATPWCAALRRRAAIGARRCPTTRRHRAEAWRRLAALRSRQASAGCAASIHAARSLAAACANALDAEHAAAAAAARRRWPRCAWRRR